MGAKQSKRSVDISGKEAESAGEVAAAGAGGEGRMEQLADADALKPQANGDAHIQDTLEKEKQIDSGTPENEKDATTEKEVKDQEENEKDKETSVANGESETKENGESTTSPDDGKKNKKEKVKKKWSLRSISFSRKDKPKQEKKQKDEEVKTNGEPEKVPEEAAETTPENAEIEVAAETKPETENKDENTPETPVTEPLTNGSSTPETSKVETPIAEEPKNEDAGDIRPEPKVEAVEPEQLPVNGLSLEETKKVEPEVPVIDSNKTEESKVEITESVPTPESPVKKEVCVDQTPLIEPTPPPLPANPPPSSVASFAATTMAPELTDASLNNNADSTESAPADATPVNVENTNMDPTPTDTKICDELETIESPAPLTDVTQMEDAILSEQCSANEVTLDTLPSQDDHDVSTKTVEETVCDVETKSSLVENENVLPAEPETEKPAEAAPLESAETEEIVDEQTPATTEDLTKEISNSEISKMEQDSGICESKETDVDTSIISQNGLNHSSVEAIETECLKAKAKEMIKSAEVMLNGDALTNGERSLHEPEDELLSGPDEETQSFPPPDDLSPEPEIPASPPQEPLPIADKMAELIPEIPTIPELNTETETTTDVAVAN
ncbi:unnamed protein product [Pieris macdunnoughi]|uniref:A-kinase anchor protein 200 n=1 Tax=Pieris macdunnoughi TaxID=345717 RepID=A0A821S2M1_9NEOP|nr:unnamed protein product [Pieris macdunnoughi]